MISSGAVSMPFSSTVDEQDQDRAASPEQPVAAEAGSLTVQRWTLDDAHQCNRWDSFVTASPDATVFHLTAWTRAINATFGHKVWLLAALRGETVVGVLPLIETRSLLFGHRIASNAFAVYGGPLAGDARAHAALDEQAIAIFRQTGAKSLEYRNLERRRPDWPAKTESYARFRKPILPTLEENLAALPSKQRNMVRKGMKAGLVATEESGTRLAWSLYAESVRNLGTPVFPHRLFVELKRCYGDNCIVQVVRHEKTALAASLSLIFRDEIHIFYAGGSYAGRPYAANDFLFWSVMEAGRTRDLARYDFGRSKVGSGAYDFKRKWGMEPEPLAYEYQLAPGEEMPDMNPNAGKFARAVELWSHLPLPVANILGPFVSRSLG